METVKVVSGDVVDMHQLQTKSQDGWKAVVWLDGSSFPTWYPVVVSIRLFPSEQQMEIPKVDVRINLRQNHAVNSAAQNHFVPQFKDCRLMSPGWDVTVINGNSIGEKAKFPPKEFCWQASIEDVWNTDRRVGGKPIDPGSYLMDVEITIAGGPCITFNDLEFWFEIPRK